MHFAGIKISPNGRKAVSSSADGSIFIYNLETREKIDQYSGAHNAGINDLRWIDDEQVLFACDDGSIQIIDWNQKMVKRRFTGHKYVFLSMYSFRYLTFIMSCVPPLFVSFFLPSFNRTCIVLC